MPTWLRHRSRFDFYSWHFFTNLFSSLCFAFHIDKASANRAPRDVTQTAFIRRAFPFSNLWQCIYESCTDQQMLTQTECHKEATNKKLNCESLYMLLVNIPWEKNKPTKKEPPPPSAPNFHFLNPFRWLRNVGVSESYRNFHTKKNAP